MTINKRRTAVVLLVGLGMLSAGGLFLAQSARSAPQAADTAKAAAQAKKAAVDDKTIRELITQLGDDSFEKREAAEKKLAAIGEPALELLQKAAKEAGDAEIRQRAEELARAITSSYLRQVRSFRWPNQVGGNTGTSRVVLTGDGKKVIAGSSDALRCWDIESGQELLIFKETKGVIWTLALSPDGRRIISGGGDKIARLFDLQTGKKLQEFQGHTDAVWGAVVLPGGKEALTGGWDQTLRVWDVETGKQVRTFEGVVDKVRCIVVSPDGKTVAVGHFIDNPDAALRSGTVRIWDIASGKEIRAFPAHAHEVAAIAFSRDGKMLASSGYDKTLRIFDVATGKQLHSLTGSTPHYVEYAVFTPDGKRVVSCGTEGEGTNFGVRNWTVRVWDVASGKQLLESERVRGGVLCVDVLPDGRRCVTASRDGIVRLWEWKK